MAKKLWGGRFKKPTNKLVEEFTKSINYDKKLAYCDALGSITHIEILKRANLITQTEANHLLTALNSIISDVESGKFYQMGLDTNCEDIHTNIQNLVEEKLKMQNLEDLALKLHTARSRNDQIIFDLKLFCHFKIFDITKLCLTLIESFKKALTEAKKIIIPGFTHLQHAQLVLLSDYLGSYAEMLKRDIERLQSIRENIRLYFGAGALAGTPIEAQYYDEGVKKIIEETKDKEYAKTFKWKHIGAVANSLDAVSDRDFVIEILTALSILGMHLSRFAEDIIIWSTKEFGFVEIDEAYSTGSSLMPQKKNPDVLELIRGYTGNLYGNLVSVLTMMKGLPLTYNRDMQLDKPPLFSSFEIIEKELKVLPGLIETLEWKEHVIKKRIDEDETIYATDWVYDLIKEKKVPFKEAHDIIGNLVKESIDTGRKIKDMTDKEIKRISDKLDKKRLIELMDPMTSVNSRISVKRED